MPETLDRAERIGRRVGLGLFALVVVAFTGTAAVQILAQVFGDGGGEAASCEAGLLGLLDGIDRGRVAARTARGEREGLARFRAAVEPAWRNRGRVEAACAGSPARLEGLEQIDRWRAAEEHAVRSSAPRLQEDRLAMEALRLQLVRRSP